MDIDLRLPSEEEHARNILKEDMRKGDSLRESVDASKAPKSGAHDENANSRMIVTVFKDDSTLEPLSGMEFESHSGAYTFYQEYARSTGFNTAIQNSRRSKTTKEFIDAKFACSRYGIKREHDKSLNRLRAKQIKEFENGTGRRLCSKTNCKASMHVKRRSDGKWIIHSFVKEHNHELLPAQAVSEQTRKMYAVMARQFAEYKSIAHLTAAHKNLLEKEQSLDLDNGDAAVLLDFFSEMQSLNSNFFYAIDFREDQCLKSLLWVDAKSRHDYVSFSDVVSLDATYLRDEYKLPLVIFVGVNQHYQFTLLGCALVSDETEATLTWLMKTWVKAMGGKAPNCIVTHRDRALKSAVSDVLPSSHHCFFLWNILEKMSENLGRMAKDENFKAKLGKCVFRSWSEEEFEKRWRKILARFELGSNEWMRALHDDRVHWAPVYIKDFVLAGMSTAVRSESVNCYFDKYLHKKTSASEFVKQYGTLVQERYEEEARADADTWSRQPVLRSPSPLEKCVSGVYTHDVFKRFQVEILGVVACHPKVESQDEKSSRFKVQDLEKQEDFLVSWNQASSDISCVCRLYEYKGYLCRHALVVLQMCQQSAIPSQYLLKRWTKVARSKYFIGVESDQIQSRMHRYDSLCQWALRLSEEGSRSHESYHLAVSALEEVFGNCMEVNCSCHNLADASVSAAHGSLYFEDGSQSRGMNKISRKKNVFKKRKMNPEQEAMPIGAQHCLQQMDKTNARTVTLDGYFGQHSGPGMVQLNLMAPTHDNYYGDHHTIQGLGQLNSIAPMHDGYYGAQQSLHGLGHLDFFRAPTTFTYGIRDEPSVRAAHVHENVSRNASEI